MDLEKVKQQLADNAEIIRALVGPVSDEDARWQPDEETWSLQDVMYHMYNEERIDFRKHLKEMLSDPQQPWAPFREDELIDVASCNDALEKFLDERAASLVWLSNLEDPDWDRFSELKFGEDESIKLCAGDVLVSWPAHDYLHIRQLNEVLYAWMKAEATPYAVNYAGGW